MECSEIKCKNPGIINVANIWMLCPTCKEQWETPKQSGITLPHPIKPIQHNEPSHQGEVFMFGPDAM